MSRRCPICCAFIKHGFVHALKCFGMAVPSTFKLFCFAGHLRDTLDFLSPEARDVAARDSGDG